ncbi:hypothetical protein BBEV_2831 [Salisediminibacterium beveridgei]|uniref:Uncharacterized protein n=1 Tax=Salisediminibacterium beveridgei TaxID=632773 RepID=A0A1D7QYR7_9BACI|nr:hypothetical protein BBEV_2831 [Salisediminibacterium beveridgei]
MYHARAFKNSHKMTFSRGMKYKCIKGLSSLGNKPDFLQPIQQLCQMELVLQQHGKTSNEGNFKEVAYQYHVE